MIGHTLVGEQAAQDKAIAAALASGQQLAT
jgi:hypothetical protein